MQQVDRYHLQWSTGGACTRVRNTDQCAVGRGGVVEHGETCLHLPICNKVQASVGEWGRDHGTL